MGFPLNLHPYIMHNYFMLKYCKTQHHLYETGAVKGGDRLDSCPWHG